MKGTLYIVSTPIGNLKDITHRSLEVLSAVHLVAAEDTRRTRILLSHYNIKTTLSSYNSFNKTKKGNYFIELLNQGHDIALVSDAGTPGISDPLYHLGQLAIEEGITLCPIPGASAVLSALTVSGLPMDRFLFEGFLSRKKGRKKLLQELSHEKRTLVLFESPHRIEKTLRDLHEFFGDRPVAITRELTKMHEEVIRGTLSTLIAEPPKVTWKGEITLVVQGQSKRF